MSALYQPHQFKVQAMLATLQAARLCTEDGTAEIVDFETRGRDRLDFASISRATLEAMLSAAYDAGFTDGQAHLPSQAVRRPPYRNVRS